MTEESTAKRQAKDSVFTDLFSDKKYLLELYQALHPEDTAATQDDLILMTLKSVVADHIHNDLGFRVGNRLMILIEAQSSWTPNILIRALGYLVQSYVDYCTAQNVSLYDNVAIDLPIPELYVIYTGKRQNRPKSLSLSKNFFNGHKCCIEAKVRMIYTGKRGDIIYQYTTFCKVLDEQIKKYGYTRKAVQETIRICSDKAILREYLKERRGELMNIMTALFDQDEVTRALIAAKEARKEKATKLEAIKSIIKKSDMNIHEAMELLSIPNSERAYYIQQIEGKKEQK